MSPFFFDIVSLNSSHFNVVFVRTIYFFSELFYQIILRFSSHLNTIIFIATLPPLCFSSGFSCAIRCFSGIILSLDVGHFKTEKRSPSPFSVSFIHSVLYTDFCRNVYVQLVVVSTLFIVIYLLYFLKFLLCRSSNKSIHISLSTSHGIEIIFEHSFCFHADLFSKNNEYICRNKENDVTLNQ